MRLRLLGVACAAAAALTALAAPTANACNEPRLDQGSSLSPGSLGPNDTGTVTVADTEQGAQYTLVGDGRPLASGVDETREPGFTAQFTMPDLGPEPRTVAVRLTVIHEGGAWPSEATLQYVPAAPAQPAPAEPVEPAADQSPPPASTGEASPPDDSSPPANVSPGRKRRADAPAERTRRAEPRRAVPVTQPLTARPETRSERPQPVARSRPATSPVVPAASQSQTHRPARAARQDVAPAPIHRRMIEDQPPAIAPTVRAPVPDRSAPAPRETGLPLALLSGIGALALALLVLVRRRRRGGEAIPAPVAQRPLPAAPASQAAASPSPPGSLRLEAELQELVAEQRARAILGHDDEHVPRPAETPGDATEAISRRT